MHTLVVILQSTVECLCNKYRWSMPTVAKSNHPKIGSHSNVLWAIGKWMLDHSSTPICLLIRKIWLKIGAEHYEIDNWSKMNCWKKRNNNSRTYYTRAGIPRRWISQITMKTNRRHLCMETTGRMLEIKTGSSWNVRRVWTLPAGQTMLTK